eukprot:c26027_g3_i1 orf=42-1187(+)
MGHTVPNISNASSFHRKWKRKRKTYEYLQKDAWSWAYGRADDSSLLRERWFQNVPKLKKGFLNKKHCPPQAPHNASIAVKQKRSGEILSLDSLSAIAPSVVVNQCPVSKFESHFSEKSSKWGADDNGCMNSSFRFCGHMKDLSEGKSDVTCYVQMEPMMQFEQRRSPDLYNVENAFSSSFPFQKVAGPSRSGELQFQPLRRAKKCFVQNRQRPCAPRNTTSFIIRAKHLGGIAPLTSPSPVSPAILPTPSASPLPKYKGQLPDEVNEWGVDGYGSMNGLIRLREHTEEESETEAQAHHCTHAQSVQQLEQRLDQDLNRFEMVFPCTLPFGKGPSLQLRNDHKENQISQLEDENSSLKKRLHTMEQELDDLRKRMQLLQGKV